MVSSSLSERNVAALERIASALEKLTAGQSQSAERSLDCDPVYRTDEAARLLGLHEQTVRKYCRQRVFGTQTKNGRWVIRGSELDHFLKGQRRIHGKVVA